MTYLVLLQIEKFVMHLQDSLEFDLLLTGYRLELSCKAVQEFEYYHTGTHIKMVDRPSRNSTVTFINIICRIGDKRL